jgi:hypothetical protein
MRGNSAFSSHGHHHVWTQLADAPSQVRNNRIKILPIELAVGMVEYGSAAYFQQFAGSLEFQTAGCGKLVIGPGRAPMRGCLPRRKANHIGFNAAFGVPQQRAAKAASFVVRMGSKTQEAKHLFSLYSSLMR